MAIERVLTSEALERLRRPIGRARGLPREAFTSEEVYAAEMSRIFGRGWIAAGAATDELAQPGKVIPLVLAGRPIVLTSNEQGRIQAFHNVCRHRGVQVVTKACSGQKVLRCPYHSWAYDLDGRLRSTPHVGGPGKHSHPDIKKAEIGLVPIRCESWANLVFVNFDEAGPDLLTYLAPLRERWKAYDFTRLRLGGTATFELKANWKLAVENFSEAYHLPWVHAGLNSYSPMEDHDCFFIPGFCQGQLSRNYAAAPIDGRTMPRFAGMTAEQETLAEYPVVFPNLMLGVHADHFFALTAFPVAPDRTYERFDVFVIGGEAMTPAYAANRAATVERWRAINVEDIDVVERMQVGRTSPAMDGGRFAPGQDDCVHAFDLQWVDAILGGGGRSVRAADQNRGPSLGGVTPRVRPRSLA